MSKWVVGTVVAQKRWAGSLYSLQVEAELAPFRAGQFTKLALAIDGKIVERHYSFVNAPTAQPHEFYYMVLPQHPLAPRLCMLEPGDSIFLAPRAAGHLVLDEVPPGEHLWLLAAGTALSPFLSILASAAPWRRFSRVVLVHAVRRAEELSYQQQIRDLRARYGAQFTFIPVVSRERSDSALEGRIPKAIDDGRLEARAGIEFDARLARAMVCGNPAMVADTVHALERRGMGKHRQHDPGQIFVENYR